MLALADIPSLGAFAGALLLVVLVPLFLAGPARRRLQPKRPALLTLGVVTLWNLCLVALAAGPFANASRAAILEHGARPAPARLEPELTAILRKLVETARWSSFGPTRTTTSSRTDAGEAADAGPPDVALPQGFAEASMGARQVFATRANTVVLVKVQRASRLEDILGAMTEKIDEKNSVGPDAATDEEPVWLDAEGSGFFVSEDGLFITNHHVLGAAGRARVITSDGRQLHPVEVLVRDAKNDLVLARVPVNGVPFASVATRELEIGEPVFAIGSPLGLEYSITQGIVSQVRELEGTKVVQMQADIAPGSSGGPLFDERGQVIGVNTAFRAPGLNYSIHHEHVRRLLEAPHTPGSLPATVPGLTIGEVRYYGVTPDLVDRLRAREILQLMSRSIDECLLALPPGAIWVEIHVAPEAARVVRSNAGGRSLECLEKNLTLPELLVRVLMAQILGDAKQARIETTASRLRAASDRSAEIRIQYGAADPNWGAKTSTSPSHQPPLNQPP